MGQTNHYLAIEGEAKDWKKRSRFVDRQLPKLDMQIKHL